MSFNRYIEQGQIQYIAVTINNATELLAQSVAMNICQQTIILMDTREKKKQNDGHLRNGF